MGGYTPKKFNECRKSMFIFFPPEKYLTTWWGDAAVCLFNFVAETSPCVTLGYCTKSSDLGKEWNCEECTDILARTSAYLQEEETVAAGVEVLQGECFCGAEGHTADCADIIGTVLPLAMPILGSVLVEQTTELCQDLLGVC